MPRELPTIGRCLRIQRLGRYSQEPRIAFASTRPADSEFHAPARPSPHRRLSTPRLRTGRRRFQAPTLLGRSVRDDQCRSSTKAPTAHNTPKQTTPRSRTNAIQHNAPRFRRSRDGLVTDMGTRVEGPHGRADTSAPCRATIPDSEMESEPWLVRPLRTIVAPSTDRAPHVARTHDH